MLANVETRNVSLTPDIEAFIVGRIVSGHFRSASELMPAAWRLLQDDERRRKTPGQRDQAGPAPGLTGR